MDGIYYKEGIYLVIGSDIQNDACIYHYSYRNSVSLFGGRVRIRKSDAIKAHLVVDGISIITFLKQHWNNGTITFLIITELELTTITAYLNAIEANGVDAFIQNYKQSVEYMYSELKDLCLKTEMHLSSEHEDSKLKRLLLELEQIRSMLFTVLAILFSLHTYMAAGLENEKVISVCQSIMDSLS